MTDYLAKAAREQRWAILVFHDIGSGAVSDGTIAPAEHEQLLEDITGMEIPCGTVQSAIAHARIGHG